MDGNHVRSIAVVGGGVAGWMVAATLSRLLKPSFCAVSLVESPHARAFGSAEGTVPTFQRFNALLNFDEATFLRRTQATFRLGTEFAGWAKSRQSYFHSFGAFGGMIATVPFHHYWLKMRAMGENASIEDYSVATTAAREGKFMRPVQDSNSVLSLFSYAYHLDADLYADLLREYALTRGATRIDGTVEEVLLREDGFVAALILAGGRRVEADFFVDCTGSPSLLHTALGTGFEDWSEWLPCDRAISVDSENENFLAPYAKAVARDAGWQWHVPLRDRASEGLVYSSEFLCDNDAMTTLLANTAGTPRGEPRIVKFRNGRPKKFWDRNCLAIPGTSLEPLEATHLHLVQMGITRLFGIFPDLNFNRNDAAEYNRVAILESERIRDFLILHYCLTQRGDTAFWRHCRDMPIPESLRHKIALFKSSARINMLESEHFAEQSWLSVFLGHGVPPERYDPLADVPETESVKRRLAEMRMMIRQGVQSMPSHSQFVTRAWSADR